MDKMLKQIIELMDCTEVDAKVILNNVLNNSNLVKKAITNAVKKEYEL